MKINAMSNFSRQQLKTTIYYSFPSLMSLSKFSFCNKYNLKFKNNQLSIPKKEELSNKYFSLKLRPINLNKNFATNNFYNSCENKNFFSTDNRINKIQNPQQNNNDDCNQTNETSDGNKIEQTDAKISINYGNIKGTKSGDSGHYIIMFTCKKCDNRTTRMFTKNSYHYGVVLIRCEKCEGLHLIADNLGWFDDGISNIEQFLQQKGEELKRLSVDGLFSLSDNATTENK